MHVTCCRQLLENLGFHDALPPEMLAEASTLSSVDAAAASLEEAHLQSAGLGGDSFADGTSPRAENGDAFEFRGFVQRTLHLASQCPARACCAALDVSQLGI